MSNWKTSFSERKKLIKTVKVFLPTQAKVEDTVQIELHKSPSGLLAGLLGRWLVGQEKKSDTKSPYCAGCKGFPALFLA